jgi:superfamily I DNA/RNA helicase
VAKRILEYREAQIPSKQQAVLFRASHHSGQLEIELARRNIPFVNAAASNSWKQRTLRICSLCSAGPKTSGTGCPGSRRRASSWCRTRNRGAPPRSRFQFAGRA